MAEHPIPEFVCPETLSWLAQQLEAKQSAPAMVKWLRDVALLRRTARNARDLLVGK